MPTIEELNARIKQLEENAKNQNSYITKLEGQNKDLQSAVKEASQLIDDVDLTGYVLESRAKDFKGEATATLIAKYGQEKFDAVKPDWDEWLDKHLNVKQASVPFFEQSFQMALGKALGDPEHPINKPTTQIEVKGDEEVVKTATKIVESNIFSNTLNGEEGGVPGGDTNPGPVDNTANTADALKSFRQKMQSLIAGQGTNNPF